MKEQYSILRTIFLFSTCLGSFFMFIKQLFFMKYFAECKHAKKSIFLSVTIVFVALFVNPIFYVYANEKNINKQQKDDGIRFLEFKNHALLPEQVSNFIAIQNKHGELYGSIENQMPSSAYLLDIYVPKEYEQALAREHYENVTRVIYLYTMPLMLQERATRSRLQISLVVKAIESVFATYKPLVRPSLETKVAWENKVYNLFRVGESIYFTYPKKKKGNHIYSALQTFPLTKDRYTGAFLSTYVFTRDRQLYFLSASTFLTENSYYEELMWTRNTLNKFIKLLPEVQANIRP